MLYSFFGQNQEKFSSGYQPFLPWRVYGVGPRWFSEVGTMRCGWWGAGAEKLKPSTVRCSIRTAPAICSIARDHGLVVSGRQGEGIAIAGGATGPADSMNIGIGGVRDVVVDHVGNPGHIDSPCRNVGWPTRI